MGVGLVDDGHENLGLGAERTMRHHGRLAPLWIADKLRKSGEM